MAAPHVAGLAALLLSAQPALSGQVDELETLIERSALPLYSDQSCGGDNATSHPNHTYGWGRIDALQAYNLLPDGLLVNKSAPGSILPGNAITYTLSVTNLHPFSVAHNVVLTDTIPNRTSFISATGNYILSNRVVTWDLGDLEAKEFKQVHLVVHVSEAISGTITNQHYSAVSDQVTTPVKGTVVSTIVHQPGVEWWVDENCAHQWLPPGETITCQQGLFNTGNYTDTYHLSTVTMNGETTITPTTVTIGYEQLAAINIMITSPVDAASGAAITTTLTATSMADPKINQALDIISWVSFRQLLPMISNNP
jgi:uncharacterized repeat protein (TIGR01451 family)